MNSESTRNNCNIFRKNQEEPSTISCQATRFSTMGYDSSSAERP